MQLNSISPKIPFVLKATEIAKGVYGIIYKVDEIAGQVLSAEMAMKIPLPGMQSEIESEFNFLITLHESPYLTDEEKNLFPKPIKVTYGTEEGFMIKYHKGGNLKSYLKKHPFSLIQKIDMTSQLIYKMSLLSKAGAIYLDIKPENILVDSEDSFDFCDFGSCYLADQPELYPEEGLTGTPSRVMMKDFTALTDTAIEAKTEPDNQDKQNDLKKASKTHLSRALGLLLCEIFNETINPFQTAYTIEQLKEYYDNTNPLKLMEFRPKVKTAITGMLGINGMQLTPEEAHAIIKK